MHPHEDACVIRLPRLTLHADAVNSLVVLACHDGPTPGAARVMSYADLEDLLRRHCPGLSPQLSPEPQKGDEQP